MALNEYEKIFTFADARLRSSGIDMGSPIVRASICAIILETYIANRQGELFPSDLIEVMNKYENQGVRAFNKT